MIELWVRDPAVNNLAQRVRSSFAKNIGRPEKLTPSMVLAKLETRLNTLANGMRSLQRWMPILIDQNRKLIKAKNPCFTSQSSVSLSMVSRSDLILNSSSSDEYRSISELNLRGDPSLEMEERNSTRELYYDMQMHLVNMLVVPKSHTSLLLNQRKEAMCQWKGGRGGHWRHQYTDQDWQRDLDAAAFLTGNSKNVRRQ
nr:uncharacterized protein LOC108062018 [Drosophila takahashii]